MRYESTIGTFDRALPLETSFFRESWGELERLVGNADRDAPVMTYCTGGIRCVKVRKGGGWGFLYTRQGYGAHVPC